VRDVCEVQPVNVSVAYLENVLNHLADTQFLGECELTRLYLFHVRIYSSAHSRSVHEKGVVVRHILQEARDKLRPHGVSSDTASEWQYYNILTNRFFKNSMKNEILASKLGISLRQLHRVRPLAIEALRGVLYEMELEARRNDLDHPLF
jgi:hypothetical protein